MLIYFSIVSIPLIAHFFRFSIQGKTIEKLIILLLAIFFCLGYMTGSDWRQYELMYDWVDTSNPMYACYVEPGYHLMTVLFKALGFSFWGFLILAKLFCFFVAIRFIKKTIPEYFFLSLFVYLCLFGPYLYIDNPLRNLISISIFLLIVNLIREKRMLLFLIMVCISMFIHLSAVLLIPLYFIVNKRFSSKTIIIVFIIINIVFTFCIPFVFSFIVSLSDFLPFYSDKINAYFVLDSEYVGGDIFSLGYMTKMLLFILFMISRKNIENRFGVLFFNCLIAYLIFYKIGLSIEILGRFSLYFSIFYCIGIAYLICCFTQQSRLFYYSFILFISYTALFVTITNSNKYIPYTNYLSFVFKDKPSYIYRSEYNKNNSPYSKKED